MKILSMFLAALFLAAAMPAFAQDNAGDNTAGAAGTETTDAGKPTKKKHHKSAKKKHHKGADAGMAGEAGGADGGM